jgi:RNA polymerase sigma factor (sigma-70 family)
MNRRPPENCDENGIEHILHRLNSGDSGAAWAAFIERYSPVIMRVLRQFEFEQERQDDCFLHLCEKLCENNFQRLLKFNTNGPARFDTWLGSVLYNLCVDWHRKEYGRAVMLPAISALPMFDQAVYRLYFERAMDRESCRRALREEFPGLTAGQLSDSISRVHQLLTPRQRWRIAMGYHGRAAAFASDRNVHYLAHPEEGPESKASREQRRRLVQDALMTLAPTQRLLVQLRYEQGLTLKKIAELMGLADPFRARREIQAALDQLAAALPDLDSERS